MTSAREAWVVRRALPHEFDQLARMAFQNVPQLNPGEARLPPEFRRRWVSEAEYRNHLDQPGVTAWVAESGGRLAGMVVTHELPRGRFSKELHVGALTTTGDFRYGPLAARLIRHVVEHALQRNVRVIEFEAQTQLAAKYRTYLEGRLPYGLKLVQTHTLAHGRGTYEVQLPYRGFWSFLNLLKRRQSK
ncbi:GNAT family N-acetyltransferase [Candidatus Micrarchaeota archaeon]|nr:GNAT family N-acetyltransferase [Candidatus Micrarchaeota archaeon]